MAWCGRTAAAVRLLAFLPAVVIVCNQAWSVFWCTQVIDPDCGYTLASCDDQTWNPLYTSLECEGKSVGVDQMFCRLESSTCFGLPTGLARGRVGNWQCIPDVYNELADPGTSLNDCDCNCGGMANAPLRP
jgi:hypothetical protein